MVASSLFNNFLSEFESPFESISTDNLIIIGDFNVQVNKHSLCSESFDLSYALNH